uniref:Sorting nexin-13 n=1 Tax=Acrobeloides nanus TaxID=290746 RepID=A0A914C035_9BILA
MSNSEIIDPILEQLLTYIIRDFVESWYKNLTDDHLFQESLKRTSRRTIAGFSQCVQKVDWVPLLTRDIVDDFASHFRLYRLAMEKLEEKNQAGKCQDDLESVFFDLELEMEGNYCRDLVSTSQQYESAYLHDLTDILLYLLMPPEDFRSRPLRFLIREIIVTKVFVPLLNKLSDPEYVNYLLVWLLSELPLNTDDFITTLETSQNIHELEAVLEAIHDEMNSLQAKDSSGEHLDMVKQELASLSFTENIIKRRMAFLANQPVISISTAQDEIGEEVNCNPTIVHLPITVVLTNTVAICYFIDFLGPVGGQNYIDCFLAIEGFKVSMEHQFRGLACGESADKEVYETIKEAALFMYHQYLSQEAITRISIEDVLINKFLARLRNDEPADSWFEQIQEKKDSLYVKMLEELGILTAGEEFDECASESGVKSEVAEDNMSVVSDANSAFMKTVDIADTKAMPTTTVIVETLGVGQQGKQMFALYNVRVNKQDNNGKNSSSWNVIRRYSDFHTLNTAIQVKFPRLRNLSFPGKKTFNNLDQSFLDRRCKALNSYMTCILQPSVLKSNPGLESEIYDFLSQKKYTGAQEGFHRKVMSAMFDPVVSGVKAFGSAVAAVPDSVYDGVTKVGSAASNVLRTSSSKSMETTDSTRVAAQLSSHESTDSIPLRVLLLFVDEVFGLRGRNQWFRRRLVFLLRQFMNAALGSSINRRILDVVKWLTSEEQVAQYLVAFRDSTWPHGKLAQMSNIRAPMESLRSRLLARSLMLSALPDELKLFIGSTTTNIGITNMANALQNRHLNRRLCYVILERLLVTIFPNNRFDRILPKLHSKSPRTKFF